MTDSTATDGRRDVDLALQIAAAADDEALKACCGPIAASLGYEWLEFVVTGPFSTGLSPILGVSTFPPAWQARYESMRLDVVDPYRRAARTSDGPVLWSSIHAPDLAARMFVSSAAAHGLIHGVSFSIHTRNGCSATFSCAGSVEPSMDPSAMVAIAIRLRAYMLMLCEAAERILRSASRDLLSDREKDVLSLTAVGLDRRDMAHRLEMSERAVAQCLASAALKLGERGSQRAVARATGTMRLVVDRHVGHRGFGDLISERRSASHAGERASAAGGLKLDEFWLAYQPILRMDTGTIESCECLIRRDHPVLGTLLPREFIPTMERDGSIVQVGEWALERALAQHLQWLADGMRMRVSVNLSSHQLLQPHLVRHFERMLRRSGAAPGALILEITETAPLDVSGQCARNLDDLSALGIEIFLDDYGSGIAALPAIAMPHVRGIKVDSGLVMGIDTNLRLAKLVRGLIATALDMGLWVVAEGVEKPEQLQMLADFGAHAVQGFYFSRAVRPADLPAAIASACGQLQIIGSTALPSRNMPHRDARP